MFAVVSYGPFPGGWPEDLAGELGRIREAGFDAVRVYEFPGRDLLDAAAGAGLMVLGGLRWAAATDFLASSSTMGGARAGLQRGLRESGGHPALAGVLVANEVPSDLARWMGPARVRAALEDLISLGRCMCPDRVFGYGNFPSTEFLEPGNADFTAMNVFLEDESAFRGYLRRLHAVAGDRPVLVSEFGLDSRRNGVDRQVETLRWALRAAREEEIAGLVVYSWSDLWWNGGAEVLDWDFGLVDRERRAKPALAAVAAELHQAGAAAGDPRSTILDPRSPTFSVIVCTRNGGERIIGCLQAVVALDHPSFEVIVVDDGSSDGTAGRVAEHFPGLKLLRLAAAGLSAARNAGADAARGEILAFTDDDCRPDGEWLRRLDRVFEQGGWDAAGGPNLPPVPGSRAEAVVAAAPGAPSHVLIDDVEAEHVPGCNLAVRKEAFEAIGGFDRQFHTAGDDVDFCWRLRDAGKRIGFAPGAFVWHDRRPDSLGYLRQQWGYGKAEALLVGKFPGHFARCGGARWQGRIYEGGAIRAGSRAVIYHGPMGRAGYQAVVDRMQPRRPVDDLFAGGRADFRLAMLEFLQPLVRGFARWWFRRRRGTTVVEKEPRRPVFEPAAVEEAEFWSAGGQTRDDLLDRMLERGWQPAGEDSGWDLERGDCRVLAATELGDGPGRLTRVRMAGGERAVRAGVGELRELAEGW